MTFRRFGFATILALPFATAPVSSAESPNNVFTHPIVASGEIASGYGIADDPFTGKKRWHSGIDIKGEWGEPVMTPADGKVSFADMKAGYGKIVTIELVDGRSLAFAHLKEIEVEEGQQVTAGTAVGLMGSSGRSTGPHLHFEVRKPGDFDDHGKPGFKQYDPKSFEIDFIGD